MYFRVLFILAILCVAGCNAGRGQEQIFTSQKENEFFIIRVTVLRKETNFGGTLAGADYVFETKMKDDLDWRKIMTFSGDAPVPFNDKDIRFVNDRIAYVFLGWMYAVTTDRGEHWSIWDGSKFPLKDGRIGFNAIGNVELLENGIGVMQLNVIGLDVPIALRSNDFGVNWSRDGVD